MKVTDFFNKDYVNQASYDNLRKIASVIDGQKNASRKVLRTVLDKNIKTKVKVSILATSCAQYCQYLHGETSMFNVVISMAKDYGGHNNLPLLKKFGNFGNRFEHENSAPRYIFANGSDELFKLFNKFDDLESQVFEGQEIEPKYYIPELPLILINGSVGISSGFAQYILPRDPKKVKNRIIALLNNKPKTETKWSIPHFNGFNGVVEVISDGKYAIKGTFDRISKNDIRITEIPLDYSLSSYNKVLENLLEKKIIVKYDDFSENEKFIFNVTFPPNVLKGLTDEEVLKTLKLSTTVTENYTCVNEKNKIITFNNVDELLEYYLKFKIESLEKRKKKQLKDLEDRKQFDDYKRIFIENVIKDNIKINNRKKDDIVKDIKKVKELSELEDVDFLLRMPIWSLTKEKVQELKDNSKKMQEEITLLRKKNVEIIWSEILNTLL